jgi:dipeptidyl aminopeptidase/acylaminoacyl peptidase
LPLVTSALLSPDGQRVAAAGKRDEVSRLLVFATDGAKADPKIFSLGKYSILDMNWAGSDRLLLTITMPDAISLFGIPALRVVQIDVRTGVTSILDKKSNGLFGGEVLFVDPAGTWALVVSQDSILEYPSVKRVDLITGAVTLAERSRKDVWDWYADEAGVIRAGIAYDARRWTIWYRAAATDTLKPVRGKVATNDDESVVDSLRFLSDSRSGVIVTNSRTGRFGAYKYDFATGTVGEAIYENPAVDVSKVITNPLTGRVAGVSYEDDRRRTEWFDPDRRVLQARIDKALPATQNVILNTSADQNRVLIWASGAASSGTYFLLDRRARRFEAMLEPYSGLAEVPLATVAPVSFAARDGLKIPAYLTLPRGRPAKDLPLIVLPHGGPFARDSWDYDPYVQFLASRGYAVLQPQFRGSTGYGREFVERGYGEWGRKMQDDLDDGMEWLVKSGQVDPKRVCIMGASYGGYAALWGAIRNPERYRCAISLAGVTDLKAQLKYDRRAFSAPRYFRRWQEKVRGADAAGVDAVSPVMQAASLKVPVLIAQGEDDTNVPPSQARAMVAALEKAHIRPVSVFYKGEGHGFSKRADLTDFLKRVEAFLSAHNPA